MAETKTHGHHGSVAVSCMQGRARISKKKKCYGIYDFGSGCGSMIVVTEPLPLRIDALSSTCQAF